MESLGNKLKSAREKKGLSLDYISRETNISARYLDALEKEDFSPFPSEPYVMGFLKNYSDYLELDQEDTLFLYRSRKIQDQEVPMEQLLRGPSKVPKILGIFAIVLGIAAAGAGAYFFITNFPRNELAAAQAVRTASEFAMTTDFFERRLYPGDSILAAGETDSYKLVLASISDALTITTHRGPVMLDLGQEVTVDLSDSGLASLRIIAVDFVRNDRTSGALLRFEREVRPQMAAMGYESAEELSDVREAAVVISSSPNPMPFTLQAVFQSYCLFRYEVLFERDRAGRNEQYHQRFEEISVTAQNGIRLGISNAQAVRLQAIVGGRVFPFEAGGAGEVVAADVRWIRDEDNRFSLALLRLE